MPYRSEAQRKYFYSQLPQLAAKWEAETPKGKKLPKKLHPKDSALGKYLGGTIRKFGG